MNIKRNLFFKIVPTVSGAKDFLIFQHLKIKPSTFWYCSIWVTLSSFSSLNSTFFLIILTFERFYSIIQPHKAALFNAVGRAKIIISTIVTVSAIFNIPHLFATSEAVGQCAQIGKAIQYIYGQVYSWLNSLLPFFLPFVLLLLMNTVIIYTSTARSQFSQGQGQFEGQAESSKTKNTEKQITVTLLLVTFSFPILMMPSCAILIYVMVYDFAQSPEAFAGYYLFGNIAGQAYFTNSGINFFLYVISGRKFRTDLVKLFLCFKTKHKFQTPSVELNTANTEITNVT